ncbi:DUF6113 family protein [Nocardioides sp.]|uniref:DUF6113 family protein n=1 Tax=Nocardioides sp. TaxID=35761 RepID=UPI0039E66FCE
MRLLRALAGLVVGAAVGTASVWVHDRWWSLGLAAAATVAALWAAPPGPTRTLYAAGWLLPMALFTFTRPEGDFVVAQSGLGYAYLGLGLVVIMLAIATIPPPRRPGWWRPPRTPDR